MHDLVEEAGVVRGVTAQAATGPLEIRADLVIAADGRSFPDLYGVLTRPGRVMASP